MSHSQLACCRHPHHSGIVVAALPTGATAAATVAAVDLHSRRSLLLLQLPCCCHVAGVWLVQQVLGVRCWDAVLLQDVRQQLCGLGVVDV